MSPGSSVAERSHCREVAGPTPARDAPRRGVGHSQIKKEREVGMRGIILNDAMVRATLDGLKTQVRIPFNPQLDLLDCPAGNNEGWDVGTFDGEPVQEQCEFCYCEPRSVFNAIQKNPYGQRGDRLWVRETWRPWVDLDRYKKDERCKELVEYRADFSEIRNAIVRGSWKSSSQMSRWASRITLEITKVRVERVQGISDYDIIAEGIKPSPLLCKQFEFLWDSINEKRGAGWDTRWDKNPRVFVLDFKTIPERNL